MRALNCWLLSLLTLLPLCTQAQGSQRVRRGGCMPSVERQDVAQHGLRKALPAMNDEWDAQRTYRQMVILLSFSDCDFQHEKPTAYYDSLFNYRGFNKRNGLGCVADYFRDQSDGRFNLAFDVYGPVKVSSKAQPYDNPTKNTKNYGTSQMQEATRAVLAEKTDCDYTIYDWNGDGEIEQIIYVFAGVTGNQDADESYGHIWPNTDVFSTIRTPDGLTVSHYTISAENWVNGNSCGIGTICHEYSHSLGLPDIYPTDYHLYSMVDEWDLMDGGNFTNWGWCPPGYSALEKMLLGWATPVELTTPTSVHGLKAASDGGECYRIKVSDNDYYLLENRQQTGWDLGVPGRGLTVYHVKYNAAKWRSNNVNHRNSQLYTLLHADGLDYDAWDALLLARGARSQYAATPRLNNLHLSTSPYPWTTDSTETVNSLLTETATPVTNVSIDDDGLVSFDFMGGEADAVIAARSTAGIRHRYYDLMGREVKTSGRRFVIEVLTDGTRRKVLR